MINAIKNYFLKDYLAKVDNLSEQAQIRLTFQISIFTGLMVLLLLPNIWDFSRGAIFCTLTVLSCCVLTPFLLKIKEDYQLAGKLLLSSFFVSVALAHISIQVPNLLGIGIWYLVIILTASYILDLRWALGFTLMTIGNISLITFLRFHQIDLFQQGSPIALIEVDSTFLAFTPVRIAIPFLAIFLIIRAFLKNKSEIQTTVFNLLQEQHHLNKKLEKSEKSYRTIVEEVDDMIYKVDHRGHLTFVNPAMEKVTGYTQEECRTMTYLDRVAPAYREEHAAFYLNQVQKKIPVTYREFPIIAKSGKTIWFGQKVTMNFRSNGEVHNALCIGRDITQDINLKEKLIETKEKAIEASKVKAQFLSSMSHEIRTPLNAVIALIHLLQQEDPREDQLEHLNTLKFSAENLLELINEILDFSKIEAGKIELHKRDFSLRDIVESIQHGFGSKAKEKGIDLVLNYDPNLPAMLVGDPLRLTQILNNLVSNAVKFTDRGQVTVEIRQMPGSAEKINIKFNVQDTGIGIPADKLDNIFDDFTQVNNKKIRQGTGLGLSISRELIRLHGSEIKVESIRGKGSKFFFELSFERSKKTAAPAPKEHLGSAIPAAKSVKGLKLLLVEDNLINQKVTLNFLNKWGVETEIADNGLIAYNLTREKDFDIILMDLQMPVMDGLEATKKIRSLGGHYNHLPILALTASAIQEIKEETLNSGFDGFISKPFAPDQLYASLLQYAPAGQAKRASA